MNRFARLLLAPACLLTLALGGCGRHADADAPVARYAAMARGRVDVEGGVLRLAARADGMVARVLAEEGQHVQANQPLLQLDDGAARNAVAEAEAALAEAEANARMLAAKRALARSSARRLAAAAQAGAAAGQSADDARAAAAELVAQQAQADAAVAMARARLAAAREALARHTLRAPVAGSIARRLVQPGAMASTQSGQALFELLPDRPHIVRAELNEAFVAAVHPGMRAEVTADGDDPHAPAASATVLRIGLVFGPSRLDDELAQGNDARAVDCVLALDRDPGFRIGQRVLVRILPDTGPPPR